MAISCRDAKYLIDSTCGAVESRPGRVSSTANSLNVHFAPEAIELLRRGAMTRRAGADVSMRRAGRVRVEAIRRLRAALGLVTR